jgi:hypothetical protein
VRLTPLLLVPLAALGLAAAGCGGGGSKGSFATTTEATLPATTEATTTGAFTTEAATTEATTTTSQVGGFAAKDCRDLTELGQKFSAAFSGAASSQNLKAEASLLKEFAAKTPSDIRGSFEVLADYLQKVADAVGNFKPGQTPDAATIAKLQKLATQIDQTKLAKASTSISAWVQKNCRGG